MKNIIWRMLSATLLRPPCVRYCSQTVYEALLGCLRLWDATADEGWKDRADTVCQILLKIQCPDGGFDIGYDFNFGRLHKKGEATSPELIGLLALVEYYKHFQGNDVERAARRAANWIRSNAMRGSDDRWAISYSPYTIKEVMVYNGISFAAGALGTYLNVFPDAELKKIYHGMNRYLYDVMASDPVAPGRFWFYSDQSRDDLTDLQRDKIDYYHQMQQVEMHAMAELRLSSPVQTEIIRAASEHIVWKKDNFGRIPYANRKEHFKDLHLWGFCSCASGFLMAGKVLSDRSTKYRACAEEIYDLIFKYAWNENKKYFYPVVSWNGIATDKRYYVRSDAWVFNAFSLAVLEGIQKEKYLSVCEKCFERMARVDFSGIENHATCLRKRFCVKGIEIFSKAVKRWSV